MSEWLWNRIGEKCVDSRMKGNQWIHKNSNSHRNETIRLHGCPDSNLMHAFEGRSNALQPTSLYSPKPH